MRNARSGPHGCLGGLLAVRQPGIERAADHAKGDRPRVTKLPGLVDRLAGQAKVGNRSPTTVPNWNGAVATASAGNNLYALLRRVVLVSRPALGLYLDLRGIRLGAVRRGDQPR